MTKDSRRPPEVTCRDCSVARLGNGTRRSVMLRGLPEWRAVRSRGDGAEDDVGGAVDGGGPLPFARECASDSGRIIRPAEGQPGEDSPCASR